MLKGEKEASVHFCRLTEFYPVLRFGLFFVLFTLWPTSIHGIGIVECCLVDIVSQKIHCVLKNEKNKTKKTNIHLDLDTCCSSVFYSIL